MPYTDRSEVFGSLSEQGINRFIGHVMRKRPSLFNYGTAWVAADLNRLCVPIDVDPQVQKRSNPVIRIVDPLPVFGSNVGIDFCAQLTKVEIDLHPGSRFSLPPELGTLPPQRFAIHITVCGGLGCPSEQSIAQVQTAVAVSSLYKPQEPPRIVAHPEELTCFCVDLYAVGGISVRGTFPDQTAGMTLSALEIVDITPEGLENSLECYLRLLLELVVLPQLQLALSALVLNVPTLAGISGLPAVSLRATATSTALPNNPAVEKDELRAYIDLVV